jgi:hypothetical protein
MKLRKRSYDNAAPARKKRYIRESDKHADKPDALASCPICFERMTTTRAVQCIQCKECFHAFCVEGPPDMFFPRKTCPCCRYPLVYGQDWSQYFPAEDVPLTVAERIARIPDYSLQWAVDYLEWMETQAEFTTQYKTDVRVALQARTTPSR